MASPTSLLTHVAMHAMHVIDESMLTLKVLVATIDAQWEEMGDVGSARYETFMHILTGFLIFHL